MNLSLHVTGKALIVEGESCKGSRERMKGTAVKRALLARLTLDCDVKLHPRQKRSSLNA